MQQLFYFQAVATLPQQVQGRICSPGNSTYYHHHHHHDHCSATYIPSSTHRFRRGESAAFISPRGRRVCCMDKRGGKWEAEKYVRTYSFRRQRRMDGQKIRQHLIIFSLFFNLIDNIRSGSLGNLWEVGGGPGEKCRAGNPFFTRKNCQDFLWECA